MANAVASGGSFYARGLDVGAIESLNVTLDTSASSLTIKAAQTNKQIGVFGLHLSNAGANACKIELLSGASNVRYTVNLAAGANVTIPLTGVPIAIVDASTLLAIRPTGTSPNIVGTVQIGVGAANVPLSIQP